MARKKPSTGISATAFMGSLSCNSGTREPLPSKLPPPEVLVPTLFAKVADESKRDAETAARSPAEAAGTGSPQVGTEPQRSGARCTNCGEACHVCNIETVLDECPSDPMSDEEVARVMGSVRKMNAFDDLLAACERLAAIEIPADSSAGTCVAATLYCNRMVTAHDVRVARDAIAKAKGGAQ